MKNTIKVMFVLARDQKQLKWRQLLRQWQKTIIFKKLLL